MEFSERLQILRQRSKKSRRVTSELCGLSVDAIRRYENGEIKPSYDALLAIAEYFDVSLDYLTGRTDVP